MSSMSREEAALKIEERLALLRAHGVETTIRNPADRRPLTGSALLQAQINGHMGVAKDLNRSDSEVQTAITAIVQLRERLEEGED